MHMIERKNRTAPPVTVEQGKDHAVIHPRNLLKSKAAVLRDGPAILDDTAVRRAEQALKALSSQFNGWMEETVRKLALQRDETVQSGFSDREVSALHRAAHDIRGQATTLGFPLASRVGASLCQMLEHLPMEKLSTPTFRVLIDQHVDAIRAITREGVTRAADPVGGRLTDELEMLTERLVANANGAVLQ
jgi:HPt (histidine-containing phosphotransfer) domain-containing protein